MKVTVELRDYLDQYSPVDTRAFQFELLDGATVGDLVRKLGVPDELASVIIVSDEATSADHVLAEGDRVTLVPPVAGG
jgi:molybdopterin converting factor small subunit